MKCKLCQRTNIKSKKLGLCSIHYARWYRKAHPERIRPVAQARYLRNREKVLKQTKEWVKKQGKDYQSKRMKKRYVEERELNLIRQKTKGKFSHLKVVCIKCKKINCALEFHHLEPFAYDHFQILCLQCHRKAHGRLLVEIEEAPLNKSTPNYKDAIELIDNWFVGRGDMEKWEWVDLKKGMQRHDDIKFPNQDDCERGGK